jgi:hypothetical protein
MRRIVGPRVAQRVTGTGLHVMRFLRRSCLGTRVYLERDLFVSLAAWMADGVGDGVLCVA